MFLLLSIGRYLSRFWLSCSGTLVCLLTYFYIIWLSDVLTLSAPDEVYSGNTSCAFYLISTFLLLSLGRYLCWWTVSPDSIIRPVVCASALTWFRRYIFYRNLQFVNHVIMIKTKVLLPQAQITFYDFGDHVQAL